METIKQQKIRSELFKLGLPCSIRNFSNNISVVAFEYNGSEYYINFDGGFYLLYKNEKLIKSDKSVFAILEGVVDNNLYKIEAALKLLFDIEEPPIKEAVEILMEYQKQFRNEK